MSSFRHYSVYSVGAGKFVNFAENAETLTLIFESLTDAPLYEVIKID